VLKYFQFVCDETGATAALIAGHLLLKDLNREDAEFAEKAFL
jgi:hypothetical protein